MADQDEWQAPRSASRAAEAAVANPAGRRLVTVALLLAMAVVALETTVVVTAMPSITADLQGMDIYAWVFSAYLLATTVTTPIYGKLADLWGRKPVLLFGLGLFALGSVLSGSATSMPMLIAMRSLQGLGAGAVGPIVLTLMGDLFNLEERARIQGWFSGVWGLSSVAGPTLGGYLTEHASWRWVFYVTVPVAAVAAWVLIRSYHETVRPSRPAPIDWLGGLLLGLGATTLLLVVLGGARGSTSTLVLGLVVTAGLLGAFVLVERRAADPILPLDLFGRPAIAAAIAGSGLIGVLMFAIDAYVPLFVQGVRGASPVAGGRVITAFFCSWAISVTVAARVVIRLGFRRTGVVGMGLIAVGMVGLVVGASVPEWSVTIFQVSLAIAGVGFGPASLCCILNVQNEVDWNRRGVATGAIQFFRTLGGALGVGVLGATLTFGFGHRLAQSWTGDVDVVAALRPETHGKLAPEQLIAVQGALGKALRDVYWQMIGAAALGIACTAGLTAGRPQTRVEPASPPAEPAVPPLATVASEL